MINYLNTTTYNVSWFKKTDDAGELEMSPPFQRNPVWTETQKSFLIDSILNGYPIPELYIQEKVSSDGNTKHIIVDGQQRIRSVLEFLRGEFKISESESAKWRNLFFDDLSAEDKKNFYSYKFVVRSLPDVSEDEIRSIFQRINKNNVALNSQELRQSTYTGEFIKSMNSISDRDYWKDIGLFTSEKVRRMLDVEYVSELTISYLNGMQNKKDKLDYYYALYESDYQDSSRVEKIFDAVCGELVQVLPEIKKTRWSHLIDFYTLFLVLAENADKLPLSKDGRSELHDKLSYFGAEINAYQKRSEDYPESQNSNVILYASGIRNSSDANARKNRFNALKNELNSVFNI
jgi:uncharacterized protein with ParB-like and HNH nuclease domain